jgi:hypothetical protein
MVIAVVERLGRFEQAYTWKQKVQQRIKYYKRILPLLVRFMKEAIIPLGKRRLSFCEFVFVFLDHRSSSSYTKPIIQ